MKTTKLLNLFAVAITACVMTACGAAGIGKLAMDSEEAVTKVKDIVSSNIDTGEWKIVEIEWNEGVGDAATLENNLNNGGIYVKMVKSNNGVFVQNFIGELGWKPTAIDTDHWYDKLYYDKVTPIDAANLDVAAIMKHINDAKAMIPAEYEFRSLAKYQIKAGVPSGTSGEGEYTAGTTAEFTINVVEKGNETVSSAGTTSIIYYEIDFEVAADGTLTMNVE